MTPMHFLAKSEQLQNRAMIIRIATVLLCIGCLAQNLAFAQRNDTSEIIEMNFTPNTALLDGRCGNDEWETATKIELTAGTFIYMMHDEDYFYFCAAGKPQDYTILDLYVANTATDRLHKFHLSAQMGERVLTDSEWERASEKWDLKDYAGFWVPYNGLEDPENRINPLFARGTHRQMQIARKKFAGDSWNMMFSIGGIEQDGEGISLRFPENAESEDPSTWGTFSFTR